MGGLRCGGSSISGCREGLGGARTNVEVMEPAELTPLADIGRFRAMYDEALPVVYGFVSLRVGGDRGLAEDITADTFAAAVAEYRAGRPEVVTSSWLRTVAKRRLIDHWRRASVASSKVVSLRGWPSRPDEPEVAERELVVAALGRLSDDERAALVLQHVEGHSVTEVAATLGRTAKATESLLGRARIAFRTAYMESIDD